MSLRRVGGRELARATAPRPWSGRSSRHRRSLILRQFTRPFTPTRRRSLDTTSQQIHAVLLTEQLSAPEAVGPTYTAIATAWLILRWQLERCLSNSRSSEVWSARGRTGGSMRRP